MRLSDLLYRMASWILLGAVGFLAPLAMNASPPADLPKLPTAPPTPKTSACPCLCGCATGKPCTCMKPPLPKQTAEPPLRIEPLFVRRGDSLPPAPASNYGWMQTSCNRQGCWYVPVKIR